ncbi:MAG: ABC transporter ATP-binding protein [Pseudomonadota bacterium]|nr:ABC transporter ATP-binding protein [Pseudomonadota bacterium]
MARLNIQGLSKHFGTFQALDNVSLDVADGEFIAILGPSGCGKTTLLRQIAGFDRADQGRISIGDTLVSSPMQHVPPESRRVGIVFQSYALWPHMSVAKNVAYGLEVAGVREPERSRRVAEALAQVELQGFGDRRPALLSGGQRQRVALARCLVTEPSLVLLDEPLANLDVHLRASMEREFGRFHERTGTTMVYITHDQAEAMALADRIAVMDKGRVLQVATPSLLYREPADETVARFIGEGMLLPARVGAVHGTTCDVDVYGHRLRMRCPPGQRADEAATACLRAGDLAIAQGSEGLGGRITHAVYRGGRYRLEIELEAAPSASIHAMAHEAVAPEVGSAVRIAIDDGWILPQATAG